MTPPALRLYTLAVSGHCHRVELLLRMLGLPYEAVTVDLFKGEHRRPEFLAINPAGQVPVLQDGDFTLPDSNAILVYLAGRYAPGSAWWPSEPVAQARVQRWLSLAAGWLDEGLATARFACIVGREPKPESLALAARLLALMEATLTETPWLVGEQASIADLALFSYTAPAHEARVDLSPYAAVRAWLDRVRALPGFFPMPAAVQ